MKGKWRYNFRLAEKRGIYLCAWATRQIWSRSTRSMRETGRA